MNKIITILVVLLSFQLKADFIRSGQSGRQVRTAKCKAPTSRIDLEINNVRTTILNGGDMWWDLDASKYEIPKGSGKHSIFAGSIMIGGVDGTGNLKMAALTHREGGSDFWPGPINKNNVSTNADVCNQYDKHFKVSRAEVEAYIEAYNRGENVAVPRSMMEYPAHGDIGAGHDYELAPFYDADSNGTYNPFKGDYPAFDLGGNNDRYANGKLQGDENIFWIFNDVGNIHTASGADPIGIEVHAQAFGFATNDEVNNMTFYNYKIINRSTFTINDCYMGVWADTDLGNATDDFVGCDVERGLGYCYNGDVNDEGATGYGTDPPAVGIDFFEGPLADLNDGRDNDRDGVVDEVGEKIAMSKFVYYNIGAGDQGDPTSATDYYNYVRGRWKNGARMQYGGNGFNSGGQPCDFMFPESSDQTNYWGTGGVTVAPWSESSAGNTPGDRRFIQSAGPFTLEPGAVNYITTGVVWARANQGEGPWSAVQNLKTADDLAQALFDNEFKLFDGPDAPDLTIQEMKNELILTINNAETSNNFNEEYREIDPVIIASSDNEYRFQGYLVYQLQNGTVSASELSDPSKARLVWQSDIEDGVDRLINHVLDPEMGFDVPQIMVDGADAGIEHSILLSKDEFSQGDNRLINNKTYYYMALAYGYNNYQEYTQAGGGQKLPFKTGRRNIKVYSATPRDPTVEGNGTRINAKFGMSPKIKRISGTGNGGLFANLTAASIDSIINSSNSKIDHPEYTTYGAPVAVKVVDPIAVPNGDFKLELLDSITPGDLTDAYWLLTFKAIDSDKTDSVFSVKTIDENYEQVIADWGISVKINQVKDVGEKENGHYGLIGDSLRFSNTSSPWLVAVSDEDGEGFDNWIRSGTYVDPNTSNGFDFSDYYVGNAVEDTQEDFESVLGGWVAPFKFAYDDENGPTAGPSVARNDFDLNDLNNVDLVITSDQSKWSICPVLEGAPNNVVAQGGADKMEPRNQSINDWNGNPLAPGLGYFPGYAVDVLTGERLNIAFAENSFYAGDNGADMIWNPTTTKASTQGAPIFGGGHTVFIFKSDGDIGPYDKGQRMMDIYNAPTLGQLKKVFTNCTWVFGYPMLAEGFELLSSDVAIKIRVNQPYQSVNNELPTYTFNTAEICAKANEQKVAKANLDKVQVVPNPYYGYNDYEMSKLDNVVKITNLPSRCNVKIFTLDGTLVRSLQKDNDAVTSIDWDVKNEQGLSVASGFYIFHIDAPGVGTKVIKWFGVQREIDLDSF